MASRPHPGSIISVVYERKRCLNWFVARYTGFENSARRGFFSNVGGMDSSASAVSPGVLVSLVDSVNGALTGYARFDLFIDRF